MQNWGAYARPSKVLGEGALACFGAGEFTGNVGGFRGRRLQSHAVVLVSAGDGHYADRTVGEVTVTAPAVIWLFPGVEHGYGPSPHGWTEHWMLFGGSATRVFDDLGVWRRDAPVVALEQVPTSLGETFPAVRESLEGTGSGAQLRASAACYAWIAEIATTRLAADDPDVIQRFVRDAAFRGAMDVRARRVGVGLAELRAVILAQTGMTPLQLLIETRLIRAQSLLVETDDDVGVIAQRVGFDDPAYFTRQFSRRRGMSPTAFRRNQRRG